MFQKFTRLVPVLSVLVKLVPGIFKFWKIYFVVLIWLECSKFGPWVIFGRCANLVLQLSGITLWSLSLKLLQTKRATPYYSYKSKIKSNTNTTPQPTISLGPIPPSAHFPNNNKTGSNLTLWPSPSPPQLPTSLLPSKTSIITFTTPPLLHSNLP